MTGRNGVTRDIFIYSRTNWRLSGGDRTVELDGKTVIGSGIILFIIVVGLWYLFIR